MFFFFYKSCSKQVFLQNVLHIHPVLNTNLLDFFLNKINISFTINYEPITFYNFDSLRSWWEFLILFFNFAKIFVSTKEETYHSTLGPSFITSKFAIYPLGNYTTVYQSDILAIAVCAVEKLTSRLLYLYLYVGTCTLLYSVFCKIKPLIKALLEMC